MIIKRRALLAALPVSLLAVACGSGTPGEEAGEDEGSGDKVVIDFWQTKYVDREDAWYKQAVKDFNESQDAIEVKHTIVPGDAWDQKMKAAQAAGKAPDVYTINYNKVPPAAALEQIEPLSDLIPEDKWADVSENVLDSVSVDGTPYAYPFLVEPSTVLYYRKDMFEAAGLDPEKPPTTWDELYEYGKALTKKGVAGFSTAAVAADLGWSTWGLQWNAAGHLPISDDWSQAQATDDAYKVLLENYQRMYQDGVMPKQPLGGYPDATGFGQGKAAMMANGSWAANTIISDYPDLVDKVGVAAIPSFDGSTGKTTATLGGWTWVVDAKSDNKQEAADFIAGVLAGDPAIVQSYFETTDYSKTPARTSVADAIADDPKANDVNPWRQTIEEEIVPFAKPEPTYDWNIALAFGKAIEKAIQGKDIDDALAAAQKEIDKLIADLKLAGKGPGA